MLNVDDVVRHIIYEGTVMQLRRYLQEIQYDSFRAAAIDKITTGVTTVDEVRRVLPHSTFCHQGIDARINLPKLLNTAIAASMVDRAMFKGCDQRG